MIKLGTMFWVALVCGAGFAMFAVKYNVQDLEDELVRVKKQAVMAQNEIRVLNAEWTLLNQPERLQELNARFLSLSPASPAQLSRSIADIPLRAPETAPDAVVDSVTESAGRGARTGAGDVVTAALQRSAATPDKPAAAYPASKAMLKQAAVKSPKSMDELIAQIAGAR